MKHLHIEVKPAPKSGGTKQKLSKSGIVDFGGNHGLKQHHIARNNIMYWWYTQDL
jgi:hypothetical protein